MEPNVTNHDLDLNFDLNLNADGDWENEATKVEIRDNYVVISKELENGNPFYVVLRDKPLHRCKATFIDGWNNMWCEGDMLFGGIWHKHLPSQSRRCPSYVLFKENPPSFTYSHLVFGSKFPMLPNATRKGIPNIACLMKFKFI